MDPSYRFATFELTSFCCGKNFLTEFFFAAKSFIFIGGGVQKKNSGFANQTTCMIAVFRFFFFFALLHLLSLPSESRLIIAFP